MECKTFFNLLLLLSILYFGIKLDRKKKKVVHIGMSINNNYIYPCIVFLTSLLSNKAHTTIYNIHIMTSKYIKNDYLEKISLLKEKYRKDTINILFYNMRNDFNYSNIYGSSITSYYKIALPSLLPNVDKIIYIDSDVINFEDLSDMYNLKFKYNKFLMGILDEFDLINELDIIADKYINAGILLMNLKEMRKNRIEQKIRNHIKSINLSCHEHHEQTVINNVCFNNLDILSIIYAVFSYKSYGDLVKFNNNQNIKNRYSEDELKRAFYNPILLHYPGWIKPWYYSNSNFHSEYWWYYAKQSSFYQEIMDKYNYNKNEIEKLLEKIPNDGGFIRKNYKK